MDKMGKETTKNGECKMFKARLKDFVEEERIL